MDKITKPETTVSGTHAEKQKTTVSGIHAEKQQTTVSGKHIDRAETSVSGKHAGIGFPLAAFFLDIALVLNTAQDLGYDQRTAGWFLLDSTPTVPILVGVLYLFFSCVWGPRLMEGRPPRKMSNALLIYNSFQILLSLSIFIEVGRYGWFNGYNWRCQGKGDGLDEASLRVARAAHWFYLSKMVDLLDTVFAILRGKLNQVSTLHVTHHSTILLTTWLLAAYTPGGQATMTVLLNSFVHTVMYSYYLLASLGPRVRPFLWWKRYLTRLQLIQFAFLIIHMAQLLVFPCSGIPRSLVMITIINASLFMVLFTLFYKDSYMKEGKQKLKSEVASK